MQRPRPPTYETRGQRSSGGRYRPKRVRKMHTMRSAREGILQCSGKRRSLERRLCESRVSSRLTGLSGISFPRHALAVSVRVTDLFSLSRRVGYAPYAAGNYFVAITWSRRPSSARTCVRDAQEGYARYFLCPSFTPGVTSSCVSGGSCHTFQTTAPAITKNRSTAMTMEIFTLVVRRCVLTTGCPALY